MKQRLFIFTIAMFLLGTPIGSSFGYLVPGFDLGDIRPLIQRSSLIVQGQILHVQQAQGDVRQTNRPNEIGIPTIAHLEVKKIYKGESGDSVIFVHFKKKPILRFYRTEIVQGEIAILFLQNLFDNNYELASDYFGKIRIVAGQGLSNGDSGDVMARLEADLLTGLESMDRGIVLDAIRFLGSMRKIVSTDKLKGLLPTADKVIEGHVYLALLKLGDYGYLKEAVSYIENDHHLFEESVVVGSIIREISDIRDGHILPNLHQFTTSTNVFLRRQIVRSLGNIGNPKSIPYLIGSLGDDDHDVRYRSISALARIVGKTGNWSPTEEQFRANETMAISLWTDWFAKQTGKRH